MHVVMLSDLEDSGGAAVAASRLADRLVRDGFRVTRIVHSESSKPQLWETVALDQDRTVSRLLRLLPERFRLVVRRNLVSRRLQQVLAELRPDVINVHNIHGALSAGWGLGLIEVCAEKAPVVWTLHDMWSFTGRCAYSWQCELFLSGCDQTCPTHNEYPALAPEMIGADWRRRVALLDRCREIVAAAPSRWLQTEAVRGLWPVERVVRIPYGLPLDRYQPINRMVARTALGLKTSKPVLLVCAADWTERRKGGQILERALQRLPPQSVCLLTLGNGRIEVQGQDAHALGFVEHERMRVLAYSAADLFVHPAQVDNLPNVVLEAIARGTPVVGLPIGGVPDMVVPGTTGWLAAGADGGALASAITAALADRVNWGRFRQSCRTFAEERYDERLQAKRYVDLFRRLMDRPT